MRWVRGSKAGMRWLSLAVTVACLIAEVPATYALKNAMAANQGFDDVCDNERDCLNNEHDERGRSEPPHQQTPGGQCRDYHVDQSERSHLIITRVQETLTLS